VAPVWLGDSSVGSGSDHADGSLALNGRNFFFDVTARNILVASNLSAASVSKPLVVADAADRQKCAKYQVKYQEEGYEFDPYVIEVPTGAIGAGAKRLFRRVDDRALDVSFPRTYKSPTFSTYMRQAISCCCIKQNTRMIKIRSLALTLKLVSVIFNAGPVVYIYLII
jgi:hypothetical protein